MFKFVERLIQPWQQKPESIRLFPLPCPEHHVALIPVHQGNGVYTFLCPHCQMNCQPVERAELPSQTSQEGQQTRQSTGAILHALRAKNRTVERLKAGRLVLVNSFDGNSKPGDTDSLEFANSLTEATLPRMPKASLPNVG